MMLNFFTSSSWLNFSFRIHCCIACFFLHQPFFSVHSQIQEGHIPHLSSHLFSCHFLCRSTVATLLWSSNSHFSNGATGNRWRRQFIGGEEINSVCYSVHAIIISYHQLRALIDLIQFVAFPFHVTFVFNNRVWCASL